MELLLFSRIPINQLRKLLLTYLIHTVDEAMLVENETKINLKTLNAYNLEKLNDTTIFGMQLYHHWTLRVFIFSMYPINWPKSLNPVSHMIKDNENENYIKKYSRVVKDSVAFLEKLVTFLNKHQKSNQNAQTAATSSSNNNLNNNDNSSSNLNGSNECLKKINQVFNLNSHKNPKPVQINLESLKSSVSTKIHSFRIFAKCKIDDLKIKKTLSYWDSACKKRKPEFLAYRKFWFDFWSTRIRKIEIFSTPK
jgi:hypothetical protein